MKTGIGFLMVIGFGLGLAASAQPAASDALPESAKLTYSVRLYETELGNLVTELNKDGDAYRAKAETRAEGLAAVLLGGTLREECEFGVSDDFEIRPQIYKIEKEGRDAYTHSAEFEWADMKVRYDNGKSLDIPLAGYVIDNCTVPFAFMAADRITDKNYPYIHIVGGDRIRHFEDIKVSQETIEVPDGKYATIRIDQHRVGSADKTLSIWVAPDKLNIAVKIVERRKFRVTTMELLKTEGLGD